MPIIDTVGSPGQVVENAAIVPAGTDGAINAYVTDMAHLIFDINGYFLPTTNAGTQSTAIGAGASSAASQNTSVGFDSLQVNSTGNGNTALGAGVLSSNTSGNSNVAVGTSALAFNATGSANTALGTQALLNNLVGNDNSAVGFSSLWSNTVGAGNMAAGANSSFSNTSGSDNTAIGLESLYSNTIGSSNIAVGYQAGYQISTGSYNIDIGNSGTSSDSNAIRIGTIGLQSAAYIAGINGVNISSGSTVLINSNGQIGTIQSSRRYKDDIRDMGESSAALMKLRPVTFRYKQLAPDGERPLQYGLVGEEVAGVYPDLVVFDRNGLVESVQYHELPALLLNELQRQHRVIDEQGRAIRKLREEVDQAKAALQSLSLRAKDAHRRP